MTRDEAIQRVRAMTEEAGLNSLCPSCAQAEGAPHRPNCQWAAELTELQNFIDGAAPLEGPNLRFGEPAGEYEIEIVPQGAVFYYRQRQINSGLLEIKIPIPRKALAEMAALLGLLEIDLDVEVPNGRIRA